jgi:multidrug efflux system membrane fusion protein
LNQGSPLPGRSTLQTDLYSEPSSWHPRAVVERVRGSRWLSAALIVLAVVALALIGRWFAAAGGVKNAKAGRPAAAVNVARVQLGDMPVTVSAIGTVTPTDTAIVRTQLAGNLYRILFTEGQQVRQGQVIAEIDRRPFQLQALQAGGNLARDEALLAAARVDLARYQGLLKVDSIAGQQVDTQAATVKQLAGTVVADRAAAGSARLNLAYSAITSPLSGQIGLKQVTIGNYVTPGDANGIAVVTSTDPIDVQFALPQSQLSAIRARVAGAGGLPVTALDQDNVTVLAQGHFATFDNQIDTTTGTIKAKARFGNPGKRLFPNQFVNVTMLVDTLKNVPEVPVSAVRHGAPGDFVFVLKPDKTVKLTVVKTGPSDGTNIAIISGVRAGQVVVSEGADGLDDGSAVRPPRGGPDGAGAGSGGAGHGHAHGGAAAGGAPDAAASGAPSEAPSAPPGADASGQPAGGHHHHQQGAAGE